MSDLNNRFTEYPDTLVFRLQILFPATVFSGGIVLALWLPSRGEVPIILFSALYGVFSSAFSLLQLQVPVDKNSTGSFVSMLPAYIATITPVEKFGARLGRFSRRCLQSCLGQQPSGTLYFFVAVACLVGTPTAGAFFRPSFTREQFEHLIIFTGVLLLASATLIGSTHLISLRNQYNRTIQSDDRVISRVCEPCTALGGVDRLAYFL